MGDIMRSLIFAFVLILSLGSSLAFGEFLTLNEIGEASCRVKVSDSAGSGTSIADDNEYIYVLTNAHVVGSSNRATCEFFRYGRKTERIPGIVIWKAHSNKGVKDFAIIRINKSLFGDFPPRIVPLAPFDHVVSKDDYIASAGCPQARWLQLWEGHALSDASRNRILFTPPPLGGQSGSGVYTVIDGDTYLCAILTWRIENNKGGAIHIGNFLRAVKGETSDDVDITIPDHWEYVNQNQSMNAQDPNLGASPNTRKKSVITRTAYYALGVNGIYYLQNFDGKGWIQSVTLPNGHVGTEIVRWNIVLNVRCPNGRCPPFIRPPIEGPPTKPTPPTEGDKEPNPDPSNPYGILPPNFGDGIDGISSKDKTIEEHKKTIERLQQEVKDLGGQIDGLTSSIVEKTAKVDELVIENGTITKDLNDKIKNIERLINEIDLLRSSEESNVDEINKLTKKLNVLNQDVVKQLNISKGLQQQLADTTQDAHTLQQDNIEVKSQRNILGWLFGGTTTSGLLWILSYYWKLRGKKRIKDMIEDKLDGIEEPVEVEPSLEKDTDIRGLADYLKDTLEAALDSRMNFFKQEIDEKIDKIDKAANKDIDFTIYNSVDDRDRINVSQSTEPEKDSSPTEGCDSVLDCIQEPSFPKASDRIKDFVELKKSDGEKVEELAFYAHLYKEAVELLKRDRLIITKKSTPFKVNSQVKAAEAIDTHVQSQFLKRVSSATISRHVLYHEAMIGFLYKQAISRLKRGEFNVLGYKEVADSVERWVKAEFMRRMGFDF